MTSDADTNFAMTSDAIAGPYVSNSDVGYITAEGLFMSSNPYGSDIGSNSKIFSRLAQGYQPGMNGMSAPLYEITLNAEDVSGQTVSNVAGSDEAGANGLALMLGTDQTPMPAGAQVWRQTQKVLVSHVLFHTAFTSNAFSTLEQAQAYTKGTIQTLGGYRYLTGNGTGTYVEYNGAVYGAEFHSAREVDDAMPSGYNKVAADFLAAEEKKVGL